MNEIHNMKDLFMVVYGLFLLQNRFEFWWLNFANFYKLIGELDCGNLKEKFLAIIGWCNNQSWKDAKTTNNFHSFLDEHSYSNTNRAMQPAGKTLVFIQFKKKILLNFI